MINFTNMRTTTTILLGLGLLSAACLASEEAILDPVHSRSLLQAEDEAADEAAESSGPKNGPEEFFFKDFYLRVSNGGIVVNVLSLDDDKKVTGKVDDVVLNKAAASVSAGGEAEQGSLAVTIDWKRESFTGAKGTKLEGFLIKLNLRKRGKEFVLVGMEADDSTVNGQLINNQELKVKTSYGYLVKAPVGLSFCCDNPGMFAPNTSTVSGKLAVGITFPGMTLQAFEVSKPAFGPKWYCGEMMSIGVWVGLLITIFFAFICIWGFSMLANIQTMDRFDDPKGKPIHVPTSE